MGNVSSHSTRSSAMPWMQDLLSSYSAQDRIRLALLSCAIHRPQPDMCCCPLDYALRSGMPFALLPDEYRCGADWLAYETYFGFFREVDMLACCGYSRPLVRAGSDSDEEAGNEGTSSDSSSDSTSSSEASSVSEAYSDPPPPYQAFDGDNPSRAPAQVLSDALQPHEPANASHSGNVYRRRHRRETRAVEIPIIDGSHDMPTNQSHNHDNQRNRQASSRHRDSTRASHPQGAGRVTHHESSVRTRSKSNASKQRGRCGLSRFGWFSSRRT